MIMNHPMNHGQGHSHPKPLAPMQMAGGTDTDITHLDCKWKGKHLNPFLLQVQPHVFFLNAYPVFMQEVRLELTGPSGLDLGR